MVLKSVKRCQAAANQLCSRRIEIIHRRAVKAAEAWVQHTRDALCGVLRPGIISAPILGCRNSFASLTVQSECAVLSKTSIKICRA